MKSAALKSRLSAQPAGAFVGRIKRVGANQLIADGPFSIVGDLCRIETECRQVISLAEVVAVEAGRVALIPHEIGAPVSVNHRVIRINADKGLPVGDAFGSRMVDASGRPIDGGEDIVPDAFLPRMPSIMAPLSRAVSSERLETGIKALDTIVPIAKGQRIGVFAAAGVGKTSLLTQIARQTDCDRCVVCLVGERGREVQAIWSAVRTGSTQAELTAIVSTSDKSASLRVKAVEQSLALAEYWRDRGEDVLLVVDSITRYAMALRELGLAAGAPPTLRAYTPNVFATLPRIVERCGAAEGGGSITGIFSVLSETDDIDDPIVEAMKSYLDGHIILSRDLAEQAHFPAIDIPRSISRLAPDILPQAALTRSRKVVARLAAYQRSRLLIESGMHKTGFDPDLDQAVVLKPMLDDFLTQRPDRRISAAEADSTLAALMADAR